MINLIQVNQNGDVKLPTYQPPHLINKGDYLHRLIKVKPNPFGFNNGSATMYKEEKHTVEKKEQASTYYKTKSLII